MRWPCTKVDLHDRVDLRRQFGIDCPVRWLKEGAMHQCSYSPTPVHNVNREEAHLTRLVT